MLKLKTENCRIAAVYDMRYDTPVDITDGSGNFARPVYTLKSQDITKEKKPEFTPYNDYSVPYTETENGILLNKDFGVSLKAEETDGGIALEINFTNDDVSACGISLPFSFMGQKNNSWERQFTASSPYRTADGKHLMFYLVRPDGKNLVCIAENETDGYRINYSNFLCGHYIMGIQLLSQFDRAYGRQTRAEKRVKLHIKAVSDYREALEKASGLWGIPALYYETASGYKNQPFGFSAIGKWDKITVTAPSGKKDVLKNTAFIPDEYGIYTASPYNGGIAGADCSFFIHDELNDMFRRACLSVKQNRDIIIGKTAEGKEIFKPTHLTYRGYEDYNLCEHAMWCWADLRYMRAFGVCEPIAGDVKNMLDIITGNCDCAIYGCTYDDNCLTHNSSRIQEAYNGVNILLDAYRVFGDKKYLEFAVKVLQRRLKDDLSPEGAILRRGSDGATAEIADYTTVTCMVIPVADMAVLLKEQGDDRFRFFEQCAEKIADFVVKRDLDFPTEGGFNEQVNTEVEEGSMSCSALTVLYVAQLIKNKKEYLDYAEKILKIHDAFTVFTPHPVMFRSSLRWWETIWEGNSDGPAVCYGHAWSVWRAEAEYWFALLTYDDKRLLDSYNCFMTNLAKEDSGGNMYAIYQYEPISSGALAQSGEGVDFSDCSGFPKRPDTTISRYVFARGFETWFKTVAVLSGYTIGAHTEKGVIIPYAADFEILYIGDISENICVKAPEQIKIISKRNYSVKNNHGLLLITIFD